MWCVTHTPNGPRSPSGSWRTGSPARRTVGSASGSVTAVATSASTRTGAPARGATSRTTPTARRTTPSASGRPHAPAPTPSSPAAPIWARGPRRAADTWTWSGTGTEQGPRVDHRLWRDVTMSGVEAVEGPYVTRRQELGAASARSLLLTILGEFVLPTRRSVWTSTLLELLCALDVAEKAARQAIMRTADSGWIEASRVGRETRWALTAAGTELLREGSERIYSFAAPERRWDGSWLVLTVGVPENNRTLRQRLR